MERTVSLAAVLAALPSLLATLPGQRSFIFALFWEFETQKLRFVGEGQPYPGRSEAASLDTILKAAGETRPSDMADAISAALPETRCYVKSLANGDTVSVRLRREKPGDVVLRVTA